MRAVREGGRHTDAPHPQALGYRPAGTTTQGTVGKGHGRAKADSHLELPVVDATLAELKRHDFRPFRLLDRHVPAVRRHGYLLATVVTKPAG